MYIVWNTLTEYTYFHLPKSITSYTFLLVFKIAKYLHCILKIIYHHKFLMHELVFPQTNITMKPHVLHLTKLFLKTNKYGKYSITVSAVESWNKIQH